MFLSDFAKGFFQFLVNVNYEWWQATILISAVLFVVVVGKFWTQVISWVGDKIDSLFSYKSKTLQYRMFWGLSNDVINIQMKDEIRRSFKENGFSEMSGNDFAQYVKNQNKVLMSILKDYFINLYPSDNRKLSVEMDHILNFIEKKQPHIEDIIFEVYIEAKRIKKQDDKDLLEIDKRFVKEIDKYVNRNNANDCKNCLVVLFGKREIAENKKAKIKTLKAQMNFTEQKLSEIHSDLISFYSESLNKWGKK